MADPEIPVPPRRLRRMLDALIGGLSPEMIAVEENLAAETVEKVVGDELARRWVAPADMFAKIQIARLESFCASLMDRVEAGELAAIDRALRILDRLDRYHGLGRRTPVTASEDYRARLIAKLDAVEANLAADRQRNPEA